MQLGKRQRSQASPVWKRSKNPLMAWTCLYVEYLPGMQLDGQCAPKCHSIASEKSVYRHKKENKENFESLPRNCKPQLQEFSTKTLRSRLERQEKLSSPQVDFEEG